MSHAKQNPDPEGPVRPHVFDGIQEYDKRMPNWWLFTLYSAIAFSLAYWAYFHAWQMGEDPGYALEKEMKENTMIAARASGVVDDDMLWTMSRDPKMVDAGKATFGTTCASCHLPDLSGGIGPNLKDSTWIHGGAPTQIINTITKGVLEKGMPTWGPVLGKSKITELTAYILSFQQPPAKVSQAATTAAPGTH
ncbi:cbb3-type cytochrome c oxidase N-terminal domain-containing protein [Verrucomicrobiota bacterium sgz303538]